MGRLILSNKDVQEIIGKGPSAAQALIKKVKDKYAKPKFTQVTVEEFCGFTGMSIDLVLRMLK